jgi:hypothetical protein
MAARGRPFVLGCAIATDHVGAGALTRAAERSCARTGQLSLARPDESVGAYVNTANSFFELDIAGLCWHSSNVHYLARNRLQG